MKKFELNRLALPVIMGMALFIVFSFLLSSCTKNESPLPQEELSMQKDLYTILENFDAATLAGSSDDAFLKVGKKVPTFKTLTVALAKTGLMPVVSRQQLTIFAPSDEAFAALGLNHKNIMDVPNLKEILTYHVLEGKVYSGDLMDDKYYPTLNGAAVLVDLDMGVMVNDAHVVNADIKGHNGVIHIIDKVLFPPVKNLVEVALAADPEFSILVQAVIKADLDEVLANNGPFTVFAPTNAAFADLLTELGLTSLDDIDVPTLTKVLLYHVVNGRVFSSDLSTGPVGTLNGTFNVDLATLKITDYNSRVSGLVPAMLNIQATNGVIHVIDKVLLPQLP